jgi:hypothetical protein
MQWNAHMFIDGAHAQSAAGAQKAADTQTHSPSIFLGRTVIRMGVAAGSG